MKIDYSDIAKSIEAIAVKKYAEELKKKGFNVEEEKTVGEEKIDIFAERGNERIVYEVHTSRSIVPPIKYRKKIKSNFS